MSIEVTEALLLRLQRGFAELVRSIEPIPIGTPSHFPLGWRKAAKGRTVWRIVEEIVTQNLEVKQRELGFASVEPALSEVAVYDFKGTFPDIVYPVYVNIKSAVDGGRVQKDDISKGKGLMEFYNKEAEAHFFVATFSLKFNTNMTVQIVRCTVFPIMWIPDIYINPSNNGNLQSSKYKSIELAKKRSCQEFMIELTAAYGEAQRKRANR